MVLRGSPLVAPRLPIWFPVSIALCLAVNVDPATADEVWTWSHANAGYYAWPLEPDLDFNEMTGVNREGVPGVVAEHEVPSAYVHYRSFSYASATATSTVMRAYAKVENTVPEVIVADGNGFFLHGFAAAEVRAFEVAYLSSTSGATPPAEVLLTWEIHGAASPRTRPVFPLFWSTDQYVDIGYTAYSSINFAAIPGHEFDESWLLFAEEGGLEVGKWSLKVDGYSLIPIFGEGPFIAVWPTRSESGGSLYSANTVSMLVPYDELHGGYAWTSVLSVYAQANGGEAIANAGNTARLLSITMPDGTPLEEAGYTFVLASGAHIVPESTSLHLAAALSAVLILCISVGRFRRIPVRSAA